MTERLHFQFSFPCIGEGNGNPLQCSCLKNPRDGRAWWAAVYGVAWSQTRLKRLSSSSKLLLNEYVHACMYKRMLNLLALSSVIFPQMLLCPVIGRKHISLKSHFKEQIFCFHKFHSFTWISLLIFPMYSLSKCQSLICAQLFVTPWTAAHQAPLSMRFSRQGYWSGSPFPSPRDLPQPRDGTWVSCTADDSIFINNFS